ncbi:MAG: DUF2029 domain-containing protein [Chloroflexi bacterium]|nr:DUF2029 domain-containing protein [Chloroflexota bacterium]
MSQHETPIQHRTGGFHSLNDLVLVFSLALILRLLLAAFTYNAPPLEDLQRYHQVGAAVLAGGSAYDLDSTAYPYAPPWMFIEAGAVWISQQTGVAFDFIVKLPVISADAVIALVIYTALRKESRRVRLGWSLAYALNPLAIMVSAGHGQFDALPVLGMLLAWVWFPDHPRRSALALGCAITLKLYPILLLLPLLLRFNLEQRRTPLAPWLILVCAPLGIVTVPFLLRAQWGALLRPVQYGFVGTTQLGILTLLSDLGVPIRGITPGVQQSEFGSQIFSRGRLSVVFRGGLAVGIVALGIRAWRNLRRIETLPLALLLLVYLLSGLAVQYLIWVLPFGLLRRDRLTLLYTAVASLLAAALYLTAFPSVLLGARSIPLTLDPMVISGLNGALYVMILSWFVRLMARGV